MSPPLTPRDWQAQAQNKGGMMAESQEENVARNYINARFERMAANESLLIAGALLEDAFGGWPQAAIWCSEKGGVIRPELCNMFRLMRPRRSR